MIRIFKESDITVPKPLLDAIINDIKSHIITWIYSIFQKEVNIANENINKFAKTDEDKKYYIDIVKRKEDILNQFSSDYKKFILKNNISIDLGNFSKTYAVLNYLPSNYKYTIPVGYDDDLGVVVYFDYSKSDTRGEYNHRTKTLTIFNYIFQDFLLKTQYNEKYNSFPIKSLTKFEIELSNLFETYLAVAAHELTHFVQFTFISQANWQGVNPKDSSFEKYISSDIEFYPKIKSAYYEYLRDYVFFNKKDFEKFINSNNFFVDLKNYDSNKYNKAVKQLYIALTNL